MKAVPRQAFLCGLGFAKVVHVVKQTRPQTGEATCEEVTSGQCSVFTAAVCPDDHRFDCLGVMKREERSPDHPARSSCAGIDHRQSRLLSSE